MSSIFSQMIQHRLLFQHSAALFILRLDYYIHLGLCSLCMEANNNQNKFNFIIHWILYGKIYVNI